MAKKAKDEIVVSKVKSEVRVIQKIPVDFTSEQLNKLAEKVNEIIDAL